MLSGINGKTTINREKATLPLYSVFTEHLLWASRSTAHGDPELSPWACLWSKKGKLVHERGRKRESKSSTFLRERKAQEVPGGQPEVSWLCQSFLTSASLFLPFPPNPCLSRGNTHTVQGGHETPPRTRQNGSTWKERHRRT